MNTHPRIQAVKERQPGTVVFDTPEAFFDALLGPVQQDSHVHARRRFLVTQDSIARDKAFSAARKAARAAR